MPRVAVAGGLAIGIGVLVLGPVGEAGAAVLPTSHSSAASLELENAAAAVKLANGQTWDLTLGWDGDIQSLAVDLFQSTKSGAEEHSWQFDVPRSAFKFNSSTGVATLDSGSAANPVASVNVSFKETSKKAVACTSGSETEYLGTLSGAAHLVTGLKPAGMVGGSSLSFNKAKPEVIADSSCELPSTTSCASSVIWSSGESETKPVADGGRITVGSSFVGVVHEVHLKTPAKSTRLDVAEVTSKAPVWNPTTKVLSVTSPASGLITGSATLSGGSVKALTSTCKQSGKTYKVTTDENLSAKYASPAGKPIVADTVLTGKLTVASPSAPAFYDVATSKLS